MAAPLTNAPGLLEVRRLTPGSLRVGTEHEFVRRFAGREVASRNRFVAFEPAGRCSRVHRPRSSPRRPIQGIRTPGDAVAQAGIGPTARHARQPAQTYLVLADAAVLAGDRTMNHIFFTATLGAAV